MEHALSIEGVGIMMAFMANVAAHFYRAGKVDARLKGIETTLNNGISEAVHQHGEDIASIKATCETRHEVEV